MSKAKKMGKGVNALTEVPGGLRMDPKNVRRRERAAELRAEREEARAEDRAEDERQAERHDTPPPVEGVAKLGARQVRVTFSGTMNPTPEGQKQLRDMLSKIDEPAPVRLSVTALAMAFSEACAKVKEADAALDSALASRLLAKSALDAEISRLANEVG